MIKSAKRCLKKAIRRANLTYDELLTLLTEIEAVLNSRPLSYISMDDLKEPLTPSHLLLGYRVLSLPDRTPSDDPDYDESSYDLSRRMKHFIQTSEKFWKRWSKEYLLELRECHRAYQVSRGVKDAITEGQAVTIYDEDHPRGFWRLGRIESVIRSSDGVIRAARVKTQSKTGRPTVLRRPIQHLYPLEVDLQEPRAGDNQPEGTPADTSAADTQASDEDPSSEGNSNIRGTRPRRAAAVQARDRILSWMID